MMDPFERLGEFTDTELQVVSGLFLRARDSTAEMGQERVADLFAGLLIVCDDEKRRRAAALKGIDQQLGERSGIDADPAEWLDDQA